MVGDLVAAIGSLDAYNFATLRPQSVEVDLTIGRGLRQAFLLSATGPGSRGADGRSACACACSATAASA